MKPKIIPHKTDSSTTYETYYGPYYLNTWPSKAQASAAIKGAEAVVLARKKEVTISKEGRELVKVYEENISTYPGIQRKSGKWYVRTPTYLGGFANIDQALAMQAAAKEARKAAKQSSKKGHRNA